MTLVIAQTLKHGMREGISVAITPIVAELPIIALCLLVLRQFAQIDQVLGGITLLGGFFVLYLAWESVQTHTNNLEAMKTAPRSFSKGLVVNWLSPSPYLFWLTVGIPTIVQAQTAVVLAAIAFMAGFYGCLMGTKITVALLVGRSRQFLAGKAYRYLMRGLGVALGLFALVLLRNGLTLLGLL